MELLASAFLLLPIALAGLLFAIPNLRMKNHLNILGSFLTLTLASILAFEVTEKGHLFIFDHWFLVDHFTILMILITALIEVTTALYCTRYLINARLARRLSSDKLRYFFSLYQFFFFIAYLILMSNNLGIIWVGMESATLCTVLLVTLSRSSQSLEAAWKYLILCGVGLAQALLGTILLFFASERILNAHDALLWSEIAGVSHALSPPIVSLAFVFILIGFGTKAGLVPLHHWLPDAYGQSIAPVLALLSGVLLNLTLYTILRFKIIVDGTMGMSFTSPFLIGFGLLNILVAAFFLLRQREIKKLFAYSSIEHVGLICLAFGIGTPLAIFAGLLHMISHSLAKTAVFFSAGSAVQACNTNSMQQITGLLKDHPRIGLGLLLSTLALLGLPPFSLFMSELLIIFATIEHEAWLVLPLALGMLIAFSAILFHVQRMAFAPSESVTPLRIIRSSTFPVYVHLIILLIIGLLVPIFLKTMLDPIIHLMSGVV